MLVKVINKGLFGVRKGFILTTWLYGFSVCRMLLPDMFIYLKYIGKKKKNSYKNVGVKKKKKKKGKTVDNGFTCRYTVIIDIIINFVSRINVELRDSIEFIVFWLMFPELNFCLSTLLGTFMDVFVKINIFSAEFTVPISSFSRPS